MPVSTDQRSGEFVYVSRISIAILLGASCLATVMIGGMLVVRSFGGLLDSPQIKAPIAVNLVQ